MEKAIKLSAEVEAALKSGRPVVALESTIISHGLPRPSNLEVALECERIVRDAGAVPATIALLDGKILVGLERPELEAIANRDDISKASIRDLAIIVAQGKSAATTVAATAHIAALAGIHIFATGGLNDPRVAYHEPAKWVAKIRSLRTNDAPLLLRTEMGAGHGGPSGRYERWREEARVSAFLLSTLT